MINLELIKQSAACTGIWWSSTQLVISGCGLGSWTELNDLCDCCCSNRWVDLAPLLSPQSTVSEHCSRRPPRGAGDRHSRAVSYYSWLLLILLPVYRNRLATYSTQLSHSWFTASPHHLSMITWCSLRGDIQTDRYIDREWMRGWMRERER